MMFATIANAYNFTVGNISGKQGETKTISIGLNNETEDITCFAGEFQVPEGVEIVYNADEEEYAFALSGRKSTTHILGSAKQPNGNIMVTCYSSKNKSFTGTSGELFTGQLKLAGAPGTYILKLVNAYVTSTAAKDFTCADVTFTVTIDGEETGGEDVPDVDNYLTVQDIAVLCGKHIDFAIGMENKAAVSSVMFDMTLPEGITVESDEFGFLYKFNPDRIVSRKPHAFEGEPQSDGSIRFMSYSSSGLAHVGNTGDLVYLPLNVSEDMEAGTYEIKLSNIKLAVSASEAYTCPDIVAKVEVKRYTLGDVNNDGGIDNQDVVGTVELALNRPTTAIREAADINNDGAIDNQDVVGVVSLALNRPLFAPAQTKLKAQAAEDPVNVLKVESIYADKDSEEATLAVSLDNQTQFTSVMLDLYLPEGVSVLEDEYGLYLDLNNSRCNGSRGGFTVDGEKQEDGAVRIMLYSSKGTMITGNSGDLFYITLKTTGDIAAGNHKFDVKRIICAKDATAAGRFEMPNNSGYIRVKGVEPISLLVPEGGYATLCLPYDATLPTGLKAYKATGIKDGMVVLEEQGNIAACTPMIIEGTAGTYNFSGDNSGADEFEYSVGSLKSSLVPAECNQGYVLQNLANGLGFYKIKNALTVPAFRSVLEGTAVNFAPAFVPVGFDEDANAISSVEVAMKNGSEIYTIDGKRVKTMEKGKIYIVGGVKMIVK